MSKSVAYYAELGRSLKTIGGALIFCSFPVSFMDFGGYAWGGVMFFVGLVAAITGNTYEDKAIDLPPEIGANYIDPREHHGDPFQSFTQFKVLEVKDEWVRFRLVSGCETDKGVTMPIRKFNAKYIKP